MKGGVQLPLYMKLLVTPYNIISKGKRDKNVFQKIPNPHSDPINIGFRYRYAAG